MEPAGYAAARTAAALTQSGEFDLPAYTGDLTDYGYLHDYVLAAVTSIYGVDASEFDTATVFSTSILRDFVHRALYQNSDAVDISQAIADGLVEDTDIAPGFRTAANGVCSFMAMQMMQVFKAFGYQVNQISTINGDLGASVFTNDPATPYGSDDSHVMTEVFLDDYQKFALQDATWNYLIEDSQGTPLSFYEARADRYGASGDAIFVDSFNVYTYLRDGLDIFDAVQSVPGLDSWIRDESLNVPFAWIAANGASADIEQLFPDWENAHLAASDQGGTFGSVDEAVGLLHQFEAAGWSWAATARALQSEGYYVSGFAYLSQDGAVDSEWLTVRLDDGSYRSINLLDNSVLTGSFDQIETDATGGLTDRETVSRDLNPQISDYTPFLAPSVFLTYYGSAFSDWSTLSTATATIPSTMIETSLARPVLSTAFHADFSESDIGGAQSYFGATLSQESTFESPAGDSALEIHATAELNLGGNYGGVYFLADPSQLKSGALYRVSYFAKALDAPGTIEFSYQGGDGSVVHETWDLTENWQFFQFETTIAAPEAAVFVWSDTPELGWVIDHLEMNQVGSVPMGVPTSASPGTLVANLRSIDTSDPATGLGYSSGPDVTYSLLNSDDTPFQIFGDGVFVKPGASLVDADSSYHLSVRWTDQSAHSGDFEIVIPVNQKPVLTAAIPDQTAGTNAPWHYQIPQATFTDPDGDPLAYTALLSDGSALPDWLTFDPLGRTFSGSAPDGATQIDLVVTASDGLQSISESLHVELSPTDTLSFAAWPYAVHVDLELQTAWDGLETSAFSSITRVVGSPQGDKIDGSTGADWLEGGGGPDKIYGHAGDDTLDPGDGDDLVDGGAGTDTLSFASSAHSIYINMARGTASDPTGTVTLVSIEKVIGSAQADYFDGSAGADWFAGGGGADKIYGYAGDDTFDAGNGADLIDGGAGTDTLSFASAAQGVYINTAQGYAIGATGTDTLNSIEKVIGSAQADYFDGSAGADWFAAGGGADKIYGYAGDDTFDAGNGADLVDGGAGTDTLSFASSTQSIYINMAQGYAIGATGTDTLVSIEKVIGSAQADYFDGSAGADWFAGGGGADKMYGYAGSDTFVFDFGFGHDYVADFNPTSASHDVISFNHLLFSDFSAVSAAMQQHGPDVIITYDADNSITLHNVTLAALVPTDFVFV